MKRKLLKLFLLFFLGIGFAFAQSDEGNEDTDRIYWNDW